MSWDVVMGDGRGGAIAEYWVEVTAEVKGDSARGTVESEENVSEGI